jgi:hypothetical protein
VSLLPAYGMGLVARFDQLPDGEVMEYEVVAFHESSGEPWVLLGTRIGPASEVEFDPAAREQGWSKRVARLFEVARANAPEALDE